MKTTNKTFKLTIIFITSLFLKFSFVSAQSAEVLEFLSPTDGATVPAGDLYVQIDAQDADGVKLVRLVIDKTQNMGIDTTAPYTWSVSLSVGTHAMRAVKEDNKGNIERLG